MPPSLSVFAHFLYRQFFVTSPYPTTSFANQTIIVTGSNSGLGLEAAQHIVRLSATRVILAVRSTSKGEAAKSSIEASTGRKGVVEVWSLDLSSYDSVKAFAAKVNTLDRLDAVIENAGISTGTYRTTEGEESTIVTNVISTFLLALLLLPKLREGAHKHDILPHLVIVASEVHEFTSFPEKSAPEIFAKLGDEKTANMSDRYYISKLLDVLGTRALAARTSDSKTPVVINIVNPGFCHSELARETGLGVKIFKFFVARTAEMGSRTLVHAATAGEQIHGEYLSDCKIAP